MPMTPPSSDEAYENKLISLAMGEAQKLMESGEAPPGVILHFVRLGSERSKLEMEKIKAENEMLKAKAKALEASAGSRPRKRQRLLDPDALHGQRGDVVQA